MTAYVGAVGDACRCAGCLVFAFPVCGDDGCVCVCLLRAVCVQPSGKGWVDFYVAYLAGFCDVCGDVDEAVSDVSPLDAGKLLGADANSPVASAGVRRSIAFSFVLRCLSTRVNGVSVMCFCRRA